MLHCLITKLQYTYIVIHKYIYIIIKIYFYKYIYYNLN